MPKRSAGLLIYRRRGSAVEVLLAHPGGPLWARRDLGAWSIPKGELGSGEEPPAAARREFREELGIEPPPGQPLELEPVRQPGGKQVHAWAVEGDVDPAAIRPGTFEMEWPPRSGRRESFPEVDRVEWFALEEARRRILSGQRPLIDELERRLERR